MSNSKKIVNLLVIIILLIIAFVLFNNKNNDKDKDQLIPEEQSVVSEETGKSSINQCFDVYCGIEQYLEKNLAWTIEETGVDFCSFDWFNEFTYENGSPIFLNVLCQEYYVNDKGYLKEASGFSSPVEIITDEQGYFISSWQPLTADDNEETVERFGSYYQEYLNNQDQDSITFQKNNIINARRYFNADIEYEIVDILDIKCGSDFDCSLPSDYAVQSSCPYRDMCIEDKCTVICPVY